MHFLGEWPVKPRLFCEDVGDTGTGPLPDSDEEAKTEAKPEARARPTGPPSLHGF